MEIPIFLSTDWFWRMPRTRNVTRAQWDAANAANSITTGNQSYNHGCEGEKENEGRPATRATRATRSQTRNRVLGSTTTANLRISIMSKGPENTVSASTTKVKGKGKAKALPPKRKKLPLQDITSQFLPAPEADNRGKEDEATERGTLQQTEQRVDLVSPLPLAQILGGGEVSMPAPTYLDSPLPPSSPPSAITPSPQYSKILPNPSPSWLDLPSENNLWDQLDDGRPASHDGPSVISSNSDPFGFVALERKLKVERRATALSPLKRHHQQDEPDEELGLVPIADTSSPRLVRRFKRPSYQGDPPFPPTISEHPNYDTPPTPHKDKKRPRLSHEGDRIFSPCSSSMPSTPSPSKPPVQEQPVKEHNLKNNQDAGVVLGRTRNRTARPVEPSTTSNSKFRKSLDDDAETEGDRADSKRVKVAQSKKILKKPRSTGTKKSKKERVAETFDEEDYEEVCPSLVQAILSGYSIKLTQY